VALSAGEQALKRLEARLQRLRETQNEAERLHRRAQLTQRSLHAIVESTFASSYAAFEQFLEDLFFAALLGDTPNPSVAGRVGFASREDAESIVPEPGKFMRWLPWAEGIRTHSQRFLVEAAPFSRLDRHTQEHELLEEARRLRNAVAHASANATEKVKPFVDSMPPRKRTVANYLLSSSQGASRHAVLTDNFRSIARCLLAADDRSAQQFVSPERPYSTNEQVPVGTFRCVTCNSKWSSTKRIRKAPVCPSCQVTRNAQKSNWVRSW
jgi:hypothetical protein